MIDYDIMVADLRDRGPEESLPTVADIAEQWNLPRGLTQAVEQLQIASDGSLTSAERRFAAKRAWGHISRARADLKHGLGAVQTLAVPNRKAINPRAAGEILGLRPEFILCLERLRFAMLSNGPEAVATNLDETLWLLSDAIDNADKRRAW